MQGVLNINPGLIKDVDTCIIYIKWKKLYAYNTYRSDCNRQLLTECKTHYRKYLHNVKSVFLRCQGYQMEDLRYNSPSELYIF